MKNMMQLLLILENRVERVIERVLKNILKIKLFWNFAYAYMYLPSYINLEGITSVTNNWQVLNVASSQSIIQNKDQTTYMFHFYFLDM